VATERRTLSRRTIGSRMKVLALESLELMVIFYHLWCSPGDLLE
jgi:hypothetical protein